jgi:pilus assembly protein CpaB
MNKNILIVLGGGFLIAVLVALMVQASLSGGKKKEQQAARQDAKVSIIVAAKPLKAGDVLNEKNMKWQEWPKSGTFPGAVVQQTKDQTVDKALKGRLVRDVGEGEPIVSAAVVQDKGNFMAATLREGMRAVAIEIKPAAGVAGFVSPGDYVDVILTYRSRVKYGGTDNVIKNMVEANLSKIATETIIENVRVLAIDQRMRNEENQKPKVGKTITLEVTPKGAEVLGLARKMGDVTLALRRLGDDKVSEGYSPVTSDARIMNIWDEIYATMETLQSDSSGQTSDIVRVYNEAQINSVTVGP